jgi:energy-coupling factor transporter ATP-binding protein EcfA2
MVKVKLNSFRIQNYRSIVDSGWRSLAHDNITVLIGQNESGKTTVLEALHSFYTGEIIEDQLRSDQTLPIVSCSFVINARSEFLDFIDKRKLPEPLLKKLKGKKKFTLSRKWHEDKSSKVYVSGEEIFDFYTKENQEIKTREVATLEEIDSLLNEASDYLVKLGESEQIKSDEEQELKLKRKELDEAKKKLKRAKKPDLMLIAEKEFSSIQKEYNKQEKDYLKAAETYETVKASTTNVSEQIKICNNCKQIIEEYDESLAQLREKQREVLDYRHLIELSSSVKDRRRNQQKLERAVVDVTALQLKFQKIRDRKDLLLYTAHKVLNTSDRIKAAEQQARKEIEERKKLYNLCSLGEVLFKLIPVFEFFEDFSGLLPNKIDLEDVLNEHEHVEGFQAAKNFLSLAGLDGAFFREKNQRILKQSIEALNTDVTVNFQDYWSQQVGKNSKIKLHFELEHYDYTVPEKKGKPYIEFWIKDKQNRLYPKQRSRGVRWFLSFYLELKAAEAKNIGNRVLLIDEPGLSLHARAQEDVLKVFEDLKESMQVIYCTHSPHLVRTDKLYRVLAVQRADEEDDNSESLVFEPSRLTEASADTLTPVYSLMGIKLSNNQVIRESNNIILPDTITYYYLFWLSKLIPEASKVNFIPSTNENTLPLLINILTGWNVNFGVVLLGSEKNSLLGELKETSLIDNDQAIKKKISIFDELELIEDVFSTLDFKKYVLEKREGITEKNSDYILTNGLSRKILATNFVNNFSKEKLSMESFDETSRKNIQELFDKLLDLL